MFSYDTIFIQQLLAKDHKAFSTFYLETVDVFFRYAQSHYNLPRADTEDIIATFYAKLRENLQKYDNTYPFESYIRTIFKNMLKDYFKKHKLTGFSSLSREEDGIQFDENLEDKTISIKDLLETSVTYEHIQIVLQDMPAEYKDIIHRKFIEWKNYETIAKLLQTTQENIRQKVSRIIKKLKKTLESLSEESA